MSVNIEKEGFRSQSLPNVAMVSEREEAVDIREIVKIIRQRILSVFIVFSVIFIGVVAWLKITGPGFISEMTVGPASQIAGLNQDGSLLGGLGASAAASLLGSSRPDTYNRWETLLHSEVVADRLEAKHHVLRHIFRKAWDDKRQDWHRPSGLIADISDGIKGFFGLPGWMPPNASDLQKYLESRLDLSNAKETRFRTVSYRDEDRQFSLDLLTWLYIEAEGVVREEDLSATQSQIDYLQRQLDTVAAVERRTVLINLLEQQERKKMLLSSGAPFGAMMIVRPETPLRPNSPRLGQTLALGLVVGLILGCLQAVWRGLRAKRA
jgi:hypothetical protein